MLTNNIKAKLLLYNDTFKIKYDKRLHCFVFIFGCNAHFYSDTNTKFSIVKKENVKKLSYPISIINNTIIYGNNTQQNQK